MIGHLLLVEVLAHLHLEEGPATMELQAPMEAGLKHNKQGEFKNLWMIPARG
jgi:hypothetical protein